MTIHGEHPFLPPESERSPVRRFRGRLPSPVSLWTTAYDGKRAGLTVSSMLVADGEPGLVIGLIDPDSDLWETLREARTAVVSLLGAPHQRLADAFGYVAPAPGGPFRMAEWNDTEWGPAPVDVSTWAGCRLDGQRPYGWGLLVEATIETIQLDDAGLIPLLHFRGRYRGLDR